ncbi:unnamed protein product [Paramecium sonneborni]|uniref:Tetratricopeptide repeat protein n=1 Tax=Paramecium sonneborni TaxID=65129 RepID=A0A8S1PQE5_9CILI|nr:unnamed protein product [Paramecium sonneborni]
MNNQELTIQEKIKMAQQYKDEGNQYFKNQDWKKALTCYHKVFLYINGLISQENELAQYAKNQLTTQEETNIIQQLKCQTFGNMAQVYINQQKYDKGREVAKKSLEINKNIKVLYRLAICNIELNNLDEAKEQLIEVQKTDNKIDIRDQLKQIQAKEAKQDKVMAQAMKKLFKNSRSYNNMQNNNYININNNITSYTTPSKVRKSLRRLISNITKRQIYSQLRFFTKFEQCNEYQKNVELTVQDFFEKCQDYLVGLSQGHQVVFNTIEQVIKEPFYLLTDNQLYFFEFDQDDHSHLQTNQQQVNYISLAREEHFDLILGQNGLFLAVKFQHNITQIMVGMIW